MTATRAQADARAQDFRRELADALIRPGVITTPRKTILVLDHAEADRLLRMIREMSNQPW